MRRGLVVVTLGVMVLSGIQLLVTPPLRAVDERSWVDYGWEVVGGDLPAIDEQLGAAPLGGERPPHFHTAAHHPPLFPVAAGSVLRVGEALGFGDASITIARLLSLAALGLSTIALAGVVSEVLPGRPQAWIGATAVLMGLPGVTQLGAVLYSDTTALAAGLVAMWGAVRILRLGPSTPRLCATGAAIALCGMVRFSALALAVVPLAVLLVGLLRNGREQGAWHVTSRAALTGGAIVAAVAISSGWFYLRNVRRYGDISGGAYLYELLGRRPRPLSNILTQAFWSKRYRTLWDGREYGTGEYAAPGLVGLSWRYLWAWLAAGAVAIVVARATGPAISGARRAGAPVAGGGRRRDSGPGRVRPHRPRARRRQRPRALPHRGVVGAGRRGGGDPRDVPTAVARRPRRPVVGRPGVVDGRGPRRSGRHLRAGRCSRGLHARTAVVAGGHRRRARPGARDGPRGDGCCCRSSPCPGPSHRCRRTWPPDTDLPEPAAPEGLSRSRP